MSKEIKIEFTENCGLTDAQKELVLNWPPLIHLLEERVDSENFDTRLISIRSAGITVGKDGGQKIRMVDGRVFYTVPGDPKEYSYHLDIMPNASIMVLAFHDLGAEVAGGRSKPAIDSEPTADNVHLAVVRQARWAENNIAAPEPPSGQSGDYETPMQTLLREAREEFGDRVFDQISRIVGRPLEGSDFLQFQRSIPHVALYEPRFGYAAVIPVSSEQLLNVRAEITGNQAGVAEEHEKTAVDVLSLREALDQVTSDMTYRTLVDFMRIFGIPVPALPANRVLPLPYVVPPVA